MNARGARICTMVLAVVCVGACVEHHVRRVPRRGYRIPEPPEDSAPHRVAAPSPVRDGLSAGMETLYGALIFAPDGTYLGSVTSSFDPDSIGNPHGQHGSEFATESIRNEFGMYGGEFAAYSPFNPYTTTPPLIVHNERVVGVLTVNETLYGAINPYLVLGSIGAQ